jgi:hypothetical protein
MARFKRVGGKQSYKWNTALKSFINSTVGYGNLTPIIPNKLIINATNIRNVKTTRSRRYSLGSRPGIRRKYSKTKAIITNRTFILRTLPRQFSDERHDPGEEGNADLER